jgi:hypothetical protein
MSLVFGAAEIVTLAYFAGFAVAAVRASVSWRTRLATWAQGLGVAAAIWWMASSDARWVQVVRDWAPGAFLVLGYWLPRGFVREPHRAFEAWLARWDARLFATPTGAHLRRMPQWLQEYFELSYLLVYPLVPAGFGILVMAGHRAEADRFWTTVLVAEFLCYALLPLLPTRPPRALEAADVVPTSRSRVRRAALWFMDTASNGWNTFPSGHVAGSLAVAFVVGQVLPAAGAVLLVLALSITAATVTGRYHFAADAAAGVLVAVVSVAGVAMVMG